MKLKSIFFTLFMVMTVLQVVLLLWARSIVHNSEGLEGLGAIVPLLGYLTLLGVNIAGFIVYVVLIIKKVLKLDLMLVTLFLISVGTIFFLDPILRNSKPVDVGPAQQNSCSLDGFQSPNTDEFTPKQLGC